MALNINARSFNCELSPRALDLWNPDLRAALESGTDTITMYGIIGEDWYGEGVTLKRVDAALRTIGDKPVTVYINSPGGDMFEGIAIYNRLIEHSQEVTIKVLGLAASAASVIAMRVQAQATLQSALATARSGGSLSGFTGLEDALDTVSNNNTDLYGSLEDFNRDQGRTANVVAELNGINGKQLTTAEQSLKGLEEQIEQAKAGYDLQMAQYDQQLEFAQAQMDALNGIDNSVQSVAAAMQQMNAAVVAALAGQAAGAAMQNTTDNNVALLESVYRAVLGRGLDGNGLATWTAALANGTVTYENLAQTIATGGRLNGETIMPGYATGGLISGPGTGTSDSIFARLSNGEYVMSADAVRMFGTGLLDQMNAGLLPAFANGGAIGETGPQLQVTSPSRIYNANQAGSMSAGNSNAGLVVEIRALGARLDLIQAETKAGALNGGKIVKLLDRVTDGGNAMLTKELA